MKTIYTPSYLYLSSGLVTDAVVLVHDGLIVDAGTHVRVCDHPDAEWKDWKGLLMIPGTVNAHCHSFQSLLRGLVVDASFHAWREAGLYRYAPLLDPAAMYAGALLAFGELALHGVTTVADFFYVHHHGTECDEAVIAAARDLGIRLVFARTLYDWSGAPDAYQETVEEAVQRTRMLAVRYDSDPLITVCPAPHSLHGASPGMIRAGYELAREFEGRFHIHVSEEEDQVDAVRAQYGCRPIELLDRMGVLDESTVAVHLVWLDDGEIDTVARRGSKLAYCPSSNMFLADGITRIPDLLAAGVTVGLGTDGACSNNRQSVFEEMRMVSLLQKVHHLDAGCVTWEQAFAMGTRWGAEVLGLRIGTIAPGLHADFVGIDVSDLSLQPAPEPQTALMPNVVYGMQPRAVREVVVEGLDVVRDGMLCRVSPDTIVQRVRQTVASWPEPRH